MKNKKQENKDIRVIKIKDFEKEKDPRSFGVLFEQGKDGIFLPFVEILPFREFIKENPTKIYFAFVSKENKVFYVQKKFSIKSMGNFLKEYAQLKDTKKPKKKRGKK